MTTCAAAPVLWYSVAAAPPPVGVLVLVIWDSRPPFEAARVAHPCTQATAWAIDDGGRRVLLPDKRLTRPDPRSPWIGWHTLSEDGPSLWRPAHPEKWKSPLPEPAWIDTGAERPGRMWSATCRFQAVEDASAADLAREMEDERVALSAGAADSRSREGSSDRSADKQWWLDPHAVTYSPPGMISQREAEGRFMRALLTERSVRVERPRVATFGGVLAQRIKQEPLSWRDLAEMDPEPERWEPSGRDRDDMLTALGWMAALPMPQVDLQPWRRAGFDVSTDEEQVLRLRGLVPALSWRKIGKRLDVSHETARQIYADALALIVDEANGLPTEHGDQRRARWAAARERNRQARRGE